MDMKRQMESSNALACSMFRQNEKDDITMKKRTVLFLGIVLAFQLTACGNKAVNENTNSDLKDRKQESAAEQETVSAGTEQESPATLATDQTTEEETSGEATTEAPKQEQKKGSGSLDGVSWEDGLAFSVDGTVVTLPFAYSEIKDSWIFDLAKYGYEDGYIMNKNDKTYPTIDLTNEAYEAKASVGFINHSDGQKDILDCDIWAFELSTDYADTYPEIELPKGIVWGSSVEDVKAAYGEPEDEPYRAEELKYWEYHYETANEGKIRLTIYDEGGLKGISLQQY